MANKPHLRLNTLKQVEKTEVLKFNYGFGKVDHPTTNEKNYYPMAKAFRMCLTNFHSDYLNRIKERSRTINVPEHIEYIRVIFQSQFNISTYFQQWYNEFGLLGINFSNFNHEILFAIIDRESFKIFLKNIEKFIQKELGENGNLTYSKNIKYIKEFKLLSTTDIILYRKPAELVNVLLANFPIEEKVVKKILESLENYLKEQGVPYRLVPDASLLELYGASEEQVKEIARNFDIVLSMTSSLSTIIKPSEFNLPERTYGFEIDNVEEDLPIIGIIDTGISILTPLAPIILKDESFNITETSSLEDNSDNGRGHGSGVAALAALGRLPHHGGYKGKLKADAKLLSIKILNEDSGFLSEKDVIDLLKRAKAKYSSLKIFVLTICYEANKRTNEDFSTYSYQLDRFAHENDCLIVICTANNDDACNRNDHYDLNYFFSETTNLCSPAESMNNIVVGAAADSLRPGIFNGISTSKEFPTIYSRKGHIDLSLLFPRNKINKLYFRPDVIECGGDYEQQGTFIGTGSKATMEILSAKPSESFFQAAGTSYSAPLVANIAAQIQKYYPLISSQSIKALIINGASLNLIRFPKKLTSLLNKTAGHGFVNPARSIVSNENSITILIEDKVNPEEVKIIPLHFPEYLSENELGKQRGILRISATLCFSFLPILNHQLAYCPVHIAFGIFKNQTGQEIMAIEDDEKGIKSKLKSNMGWSQSARHKEKPIPYSNTQKISFPVNVDDLLNENNTFKLAVNCRINPQLVTGTEARYKSSHKFSIALTIEETLMDGELTGKLYNGMCNVNILENITSVELEAEAFADSEL